MCNDLAKAIFKRFLSIIGTTFLAVTDASCLLTNALVLVSARLMCTKECLSMPVKIIE